MYILETIKQKINYIDVGARGKLEYPWDSLLNTKVRVVGFEPDKYEAERLRIKNPSNVYYDIGLGASREVKKFYLNKDSFTSSMYPPNRKKIESFEERHWINRVVEKEISLPVSTLDEVLSSRKIDVDFIKIDTQGSELDILSGAKEILTKNFPIILAETWFYPVYQGMPLAGDVLTLLHKLDYRPIDFNLAAAWRYKVTPKILSGKQSLIGMDFLFMREPDSIIAQKPNLEKLERICALLELYGFRDIALYILEKSEYLGQSRNSLILAMEENEKKEFSFLGKFKKSNKKYLRILAKLFFGEILRTPKLHY